ncbi:MAG: enolase C-terminal domain-like protein [Gemmatales bacterium]|nr:enolase C-terminal domain-like protein [Gemmatales bacterium]
MPNPAIRIEDVLTNFECYRYRTPIKFGGVAFDRATILNVRMQVCDTRGRQMIGFGSMPLGNVWAFPSRRLTYDQTLSAMRQLAERFREEAILVEDYGHPMELGLWLEERFLRAASEVAARLQLTEPIPKLAVLVVGSAFDAAVHDAYGKLLGRSAYHCYGPDCLPGDLSRWLGRDFRGQTLEQYISREPKPKLPLYHLVGALDPLEAEDVAQPVGDGLPETLGEWITYNGLTHLKIKLNGDDLAWDVERVVRVDRVAEQVQSQCGIVQWWYSLDFNERCGTVDYLLEFMKQLQERAPRAWQRVQYIEQPTHRDLKTHGRVDLHAASQWKPIVADEALTDLESLYLARDLGYTGVALKACKGQTQSLLAAAAAQKLGMFVCVQDLTCPGASLIHSAGLAAHVPPVAAIEANARQYMPQANRAWEKRFPGIFRITDGYMRTGEITGPGLGAVPPEVPAGSEPVWENPP